jgi:hypothetical protein
MLVDRSDEKGGRRRCGEQDIKIVRVMSRLIEDKVVSNVCKALIDRAGQLMLLLSGNMTQAWGQQRRVRGVSEENREEIGD